MKQLLLLIMVILTACNTTSATLPQMQLQTSYQVEWIGDRPLIDSSYLNITLDKDNKAYGLAGCNYWSTNYQLKDNTVSFDKPIAVTKKLCAPALMEQEQRFLKALATVKKWDFSGIHQLRLWPEQGQPIKLWPEEKR